MIHTGIEIFFAYMVLFWLLENFFMAIFFQLYARLNTLFNLSLMLLLNAAVIAVAYAIGSYMLFAFPLGTVLCIAGTFVGVLESTCWLAQGYAYEIGAIVAAQALSLGALLSLFLLSQYVF